MTEFIQVVCEEWRTDGGTGWVSGLVLVTGASPGRVAIHFLLESIQPSYLPLN